MRNVAGKSCRVCQNVNTHILHSMTFSENRAFYELMWTNIVQPDRSQMIIQYGASALRAGRLTLQTHSQNM